MSSTHLQYRARALVVQFRDIYIRGRLLVDMSNKKKPEYELLPTKRVDEFGSSCEEETYFTSPALKKTKNDALGSLLLSTSFKKIPPIGVAITLLLILLLILSSLIVVFMLERFHGGSRSSTNTSSNTSDSSTSLVKQKLFWAINLDHSFSELSLVEHDMNQDGVSDFIIDSSSWRVNEPKYIACPNKPNDCERDFGFTPCRAQLLALNGLDGSVLWEKWVEYSPFSANCEHDLNEDGLHDCIFAGRLGLLMAINIVDGSYIWFADPLVTFPMYNYFSPLVIQDFDRDGIIDLVVTHGGDPTYDSNEKNRSPGFIFVLSGRTGQQLSERIPMPDGHETYSSPITYNISHDIEMILFGSGGETVPGSLWGITTRSLQMHVDAWTPKRNAKYHPQKDYINPKCSNKEEIELARPRFIKDTFKYVNEREDWMLKICSVWNRNSKTLWNPYHVCVYEVVSAGKTGTMQPPVIVDFNGDGIKDLLVSQFNDRTILFNGASNPMKEVWNHTVGNTQSYSIPAPLHFNEDDELDFLTRYNKGEWMQYDYSYMGILDGKSGSLLWTLNCSFGSMSSPITIKSRKNGHDGMLFIATGCESPTSNHIKRREKLTGNIVEHSVNLRHHDDDTCEALTARKERHETNTGGGGSDTAADSADEGLFSSSILSHIPANLWYNDDEFPDPWSETELFIQNYCNIPYNKMITSIYFLTPNMIKSGHVKPIYEHKPYVYKAPSTGYVGDDRQDESKSHSTDDHRYSKKFLRCAHILLPIQAITTPVVGDFDHDGRLDAATTIGYDGMPDESYEFSILHPSNVSVQIFNIEDRLTEIFGPKIKNIVSFDSYFPANTQPWKKYMGSAGNGIYKMPHEK